jgi:hypothetical protein
VYIFRFNHVVTIFAINDFTAHNAITAYANIVASVYRMVRRYIIAQYPRLYHRSGFAVFAVIGCN